MATKRPVSVVVSAPAPMDIGTLDAIGQGTSHSFQMLAKVAEGGHRTGDLFCRRLIKAQCVTIIEDDAEIHQMCLDHPKGEAYARALIGPVTGQ